VSEAEPRGREMLFFFYATEQFNQSAYSQFSECIIEQFSGFFSLCDIFFVRGLMACFFTTLP